MLAEGYFDPSIYPTNALPFAPNSLFQPFPVLYASIDEPQVSICAYKQGLSSDIGNKGRSLRVRTNP